MKTQNEIRQIVEALIANGTPVLTYAKFARVSARPAIDGEVVATVLADGTVETTNTANAGDWIVTNPGGEAYIVPAAKFPKKYEPCPGTGLYRPTGGVQKFITIDEALDFVAPWGEEQHMKADAKLNVTNLNDIYGINEPEFSDTYAACDEKGNFIQ